MGSSLHRVLQLPRGEIDKHVTGPSTVHGASRRLQPHGTKLQWGQGCARSVSSNAQHEGRTIGHSFYKYTRTSSEVFPASKCTW